ncbi:MAG: PEP-CTERM sorting domain-containing protein [Burkholderiales bacterium]|nr:PEP-CTERM sorting domain-containing protein [Burkholderiales bacterium]
MKKLLAALALPLALLASTDSRAVAIEVTFAGQATGTLVYEAISITDPIQSILSFDFALPGLTFDENDIGFFDVGLGSTFIGATVNDVSFVLADTPDFFFVLHRGPGPNALTSSVYSYPGLGRVVGFSGTSTSRVLNAVPEPSALALLGAIALASAVTHRLSRRK